MLYWKNGLEKHGLMKQTNYFLRNVSRRYQVYEQVTKHGKGIRRETASLSTQHSSQLTKLCCYCSSFVMTYVGVKCLTRYCSVLRDTHNSWYNVEKIMSILEDSI